MEDHRYTDRTLDLWRELRPLDRSNGADVGVVIQAALRRSEQDVEAIIAEGGSRPAVQGGVQGAASRSRSRTRPRSTRRTSG